MKSKVLHFKYKPGGSSFEWMHDVHGKFMPQGRYALNKTEWRGKPPKSCAVTRLSMPPTSPGAEMIVDIEITERPTGFISYTGNTRYDGWTAMMVKEPNKILADGEVPEYVPTEVYGEMEFNDLDFGEFIREEEIEDVQETTEDLIIEELKASGKISMTMKPSFMAPHRSRPFTKVILSNDPDGEAIDGFGSRVVNLWLGRPNVEQVLMRVLKQLMSDFMEGKASITCYNNDDLTFVKLSDVLVDCEPNEIGEDSWFDVLHYYTPITFLKDLALQLMAKYEVKAEIVNGKGGGILIRREIKN